MQEAVFFGIEEGGGALLGARIHHCFVLPVFWAVVAVDDLIFVTSTCELIVSSWLIQWFLTIETDDFLFQEAALHGLVNLFG